MDAKKLLEYLSIVVDLEKNKYAQEKALQKLQGNINSYRTEYNNNQNLNAREYPAISMENVKVDESGKGLMYFMIYYVGCLGACLGVAVKNITGSMPLALITGAIGAVVGGYIPVIVWKNILNKRRERALIHLRRGQRADNDMKIDRQARNNELIVVVPKLEEQCRALKQTYTTTCNTLKRFYELDIIPHSYRSLVPVCMFYDYVKNGRTYCIRKDPVTFDEGAVNIYEEQLKHNEIIAHMNTIISKLDELSVGQKVLCDVIREGNAQTHKLLGDINNSISVTNKKLDNIEYHAANTSRCASYLASVAYFR